MINNVIKFFQRDDSPLDPVVDLNTYSVGETGALDVDAAIGFEKGQCVIAVDFDFSYAPSFITFDESDMTMQLMQDTGDFVTLSRLDLSKVSGELSSLTKVALVTGVGEDKIIQIIPFRVQSTQSLRRAS